MKKRPIVADVRELPLGSHSRDGFLVVAEAGQHIPFVVPRVFCVYGVKPGTIRGQHAHKECAQILICVSGKCEVTCDDGSERRTFSLGNPAVGLLVPPMIWAEEKYMVENTVLLVLTDHRYDETDYIKHYDEFLEYWDKSGVKK
jgi:dTDP-4-dehydrorhamnose 3,5-epimerase-like enzyme